MKPVYPSADAQPSHSRRRFVQGLALGGAFAGVGLWHSSPVWALTSAGQPTVPGGADFSLDVIEAPVNYTGAPRLATTVNGSVPGPVLRMRQGSTVTLRVTNRLRVPTSIHWHGILLPFQMDGVPGISFPGIAPAKPSPTASR
jgi:Putative multicopper oxidases